MVRCSLVIPAKNEGTQIVKTLSAISSAINFPFEGLIVLDSENDTTVKVLGEFLDNNPKFRILLNNGKQGPASAIKFGIDNCNSEIVVITMADGSDDPKSIDPLVNLIERGVAIASASRYMSGGQQIGAPLLKSFLSRFAGLSLYYIRRIGTKDPTNSFKAYNMNFLREVGIESNHGFEMALELTAKAKRHGFTVAEFPTIWIERGDRKSNFKLFRWIPRYLYWYFYAFRIGRGKR